MRRALVAEDDPDIVELVTHYLQPDGWTVDARADGRHAQDLLKQGPYEL
jgi:DNA-binding response OmpR family regulator